MKPQSRADFMFVGVAIIPGVLLWFGAIGPALLLFFPLLLVACMFGWHEQIESDDPPGDRGKGRREPTNR